EFGHPAELCFREYGAVMTDQILSDDAGSAYSDTTLEHPFQANLDVAARFHCEVIDLLHHRLGTTSVDRVKMSVLQNGLGDLRDLIFLSVRSVVGCENEFEIVFFAVRYQPVFEEELAGGPRSRDKSHVASAEMNQKRKQGNKACPTSDHQEFMMVTNAVWMSIRSPDPEQVARLLLPESCTDRATFLDNNPRFVLAMNCEYAHRDLVDARDPDHGGLSRVRLVQAR